MWYACYILAYTSDWVVVPCHDHHHANRVIETVTHQKHVAYSTIVCTRWYQTPHQILAGSWYTLDMFGVLQNIVHTVRGVRV